MLKLYRNAFFQLIKEAGLDPADFSPADANIDSRLAFIITYRASTLRFVVRFSEDDPNSFDYKFTKMAPGYPFTGYFPKDGFTRFEIVSDEFSNWLRKHVSVFVEDSKRPDLWAQLREGFEPPILSQELGGNSPFSENELERISKELREALAHVKSRPQLTTGQLQALEEKIDYLMDSSKRLGRKDWCMLLVGALMAYAVQSALTPEVANKVFHLVTNGLRWIYRAELP